MIKYTEGKIKELIDLGFKITKDFDDFLLSPGRFMEREDVVKELNGGIIVLAEKEIKDDVLFVCIDRHDSFTKDEHTFFRLSTMEMSYIDTSDLDLDYIIDAAIQYC